MAVLGGWKVFMHETFLYVLGRGMKIFTIKEHFNLAPCCYCWPFPQYCFKHMLLYQFPQLQYESKCSSDKKNLFLFVEHPKRNVLKKK